MKKKLWLMAVLVIISLSGVVVFGLGNRRITVYVNGKPAAGQSLTSLDNLELIPLDDSGSADLPWSLGSEESSVLFQAGPDQVCLLTLPRTGSRIYRISGPKIVTEEFLLDLGFTKIRRRVSQGTVIEHELQNNEANSHHEDAL